MFADPLRMRKKPPEPCHECGQRPCVCKKKKVKIKLRDGKEREIQYMVSTSFWGADGKPISVQEFMDNLYGVLPSYFKDEVELRAIWSDPTTRKALLVKLGEAGYGESELGELQRLVDAEHSDLFDVLEYIAYNVQTITRDERVAQTKSIILAGLTKPQQDFLEFILFKYIETGYGELDQSKLPNLIQLKFNSMTDATEELGDVNQIRNLFFNFQKQLYEYHQAI